MNEQKIQSLMKNLKCSREEAIEVLNEDIRINKMKPSEVNADLTPEQLKASKDARKIGKKPTTIKFDTTNRKKKENPDKQYIVSQFAECVNNFGASYEIINAEREFVFDYKGVKYKVVVSVPRS